MSLSLAFPIPFPVETNPVYCLAILTLTLSGNTATVLLLSPPIELWFFAGWHPLYESPRRYWDFVENGPWRSTWWWWWWVYMYFLVSGLPQGFPSCCRVKVERRKKEMSKRCERWMESGYTEGEFKMKTASRKFMVSVKNSLFSTVTSFSSQLQVSIFRVKGAHSDRGSDPEIFKILEKK